MKSSLTKVSLTLLSAVFILGCQDMGSGPVGLDDLGPQFAKVIKNCDPDIGPVHPSCKDGGDDGGGPTVADATVVLSGGMVTSTPQGVRIQRESDSKIVLEDVRDENGASTFSSEIALTLTHAVALADLDGAGFPGSSGCVVKLASTPEEDKKDVILGLLDKFLHLEQVRFFEMTIDKTALGSASAGHNIGSTFTDIAEDATELLISLRAGTNKKLLPGVSATVTVLGGGNIDGNFTVEFSGGAASVRDRTGKVKDHVELACPNLDIITVVVTRSS